MPPEEPSTMPPVWLADRPRPPVLPLKGDREKPWEVRQVISKRMVKKQQMRWTPHGAHLLLQVRTRVLNDQLANDFHRWYPGFNQAPDPVALAA